MMPRFWPPTAWPCRAVCCQPPARPRRERIRGEMDDHGASGSDFAHDGAENILNDQFLGWDKLWISWVLHL
jgi:hypothetical protein